VDIARLIEDFEQNIQPHLRDAPRNASAIWSGLFRPGMISGDCSFVPPVLDDFRKKVAADLKLEDCCFHLYGGLPAGYLAQFITDRLFRKTTRVPLRADQIFGLIYYLSLTSGANLSNVAVWKAEASGQVPAYMTLPALLPGDGNPELFRYGLERAECALSWLVRATRAILENRYETPLKVKKKSLRSRGLTLPVRDPLLAPRFAASLDKTKMMKTLPVGRPSKALIAYTAVEFARIFSLAHRMMVKLPIAMGLRLDDGALLPPGAGSSYLDRASKNGGSFDTGLHDHFLDFSVSAFQVDEQTRRPKKLLIGTNKLLYKEGVVDPNHYAAWGIWLREEIFRHPFSGGSSIFGSEVSKISKSCWKSHFDSRKKETLICSMLPELVPAEWETLLPEDSRVRKAGWYDSSQAFPFYGKVFADYDPGFIDIDCFYLAWRNARTYLEIGGAHKAEPDMIDGARWFFPPPQDLEKHMKALQAFSADRWGVDAQARAMLVAGAPIERPGMKPYPYAKTDEEKRLAARALDLDQRGGR
jgi:hypothetical protein